MFDGRVPFPRGGFLVHSVVGGFFAGRWEDDGETGVLVAGSWRNARAWAARADAEAVCDELNAEGRHGKWTVVADDGQP